MCDGGMSGRSWSVTVRRMTCTSIQHHTSQIMIYAGVEVRVLRIAYCVVVWCGVVELPFNLQPVCDHQLPSTTKAHTCSCLTQRRTCTLIISAYGCCQVSISHMMMAKEYTSAAGPMCDERMTCAPPPPTPPPCGRKNQDARLEPTNQPTNQPPANKAAPCVSKSHEPKTSSSPSLYPTRWTTTRLIVHHDTVRSLTDCVLFRIKPWHNTHLGRCPPRVGCFGHGDGRGVCCHHAR